MREMQHYNEIKYTCFEALKFTNNQICLAGFFIIIYLCWNISSSVFQRHLLLSVPKEILKSTVFHFQVLSQQCVHPHGFTFLQSKDRTRYPQGAGWAALNSSTQFAAKPFPCQLLCKPLPQPLTWKNILTFQLCVHAIFWTLQLITNASSMLVMWIPG